MFLLPSEVGFLKLLKENRVPLVEVRGNEMHDARRY
jgi:hypothetical protein